MNVPSPTQAAATPGENDHAGSDFVGGIPHGFPAYLDRAYQRYTQGDLTGAITDCNGVAQLDRAAWTPTAFWPSVITRAQTIPASSRIAMRLCGSIPIAHRL